MYTETTVPIINSEAKEEAFLHFLYKVSQTQELMSRINGPMRSSPNLNYICKAPTEIIGKRSLKQLNTTNKMRMPTTSKSKSQTCSATSLPKSNVLKWPTIWYKAKSLPILAMGPNHHTMTLTYFCQIKFPSL
jgi:hypothetical protein